MKMLKINKNLTTKNYNQSRNRQIKYIVIHFTANNGDTALGNTNYFKNTYRGASAHYFVDEKEIWQCVEDKDKSWHCGTTGKYYHNYCRNYNSIGIEMCSRKDSRNNYYIKEEVVKNTIELTKYLMKKYNVPKERVIRHYDVTHKICPAPFVYNQELWNNFLYKLDNTEIKECDNMIYNKLEEIPDYAKEAIKHYIDNGSLKGTGYGLNLTLDMIRILTIIYNDKKVV